MQNENIIIEKEPDTFPTFEKMKVPISLLNEKLHKFSDLELQGQNTHTAVKTMFRDERIKTPAWVLFFAMYGMIRFRRGLLESEGRKNGK